MKKKKKVLMLSVDETLFSQKSTDSLHRHLDYAKEFKKLTIIVFSRNKYKKIKEKNLEIIPTNSGNMIKGFFDIIKVSYKLSRKEKVEVITTQTPFFLGFIGLIVSKIFKAKLRPQLHIEAFSNPYWRKERIINYLKYLTGLIVIRFCDSIRVVSKRSEKYFSERQINCEFIPVSTDLKKFEQEKSKNEIDILTVARLTKQKNLFFFLDVIAKIHERHTDIKVVIVGGGEQQKDLERYIIRKGLAGNVELTGNLKIEEVKKYYSKAKIFVLPSLYEGWGLVCIEAAMAKTPVIMSNTGCAGEIIVNNESGIVCAVNSENDFINAIRSYCKNPPLRKEHALAAKKKCLEKLQTKKLRKKWTDFLNN